MENWLRTYDILAGVPGSEGFVIGQETEGKAIHVNFDIQKTDTQSSNQCKLQIWNLNDQHKGVLKEKGCVVEIRAGYGGKNFPAFLGDVSETTESIDNSDRMFEVELKEGRTAFYTVSNISIAGSFPCGQVVTALLQDMGFASSVNTANAAQLMTETKYDNGYSFVGRSVDGLTAVLEKCGCTWSLQNGVMQIYVKGEVVNQTAYVLDVRSGLINIPKKVTISNGSGKNKSDVPGYEVQYLMNCAIGVNDLIQVVSKDLNGFFRVQKLHIVGDNYDGDWICTAQVLDPAASASMAEASGNVGKSAEASTGPEQSTLKNWTNLLQGGS